MSQSQVREKGPPTNAKIVPVPAAPPPRSQLAHPITFFFTAAQRAAVLRKLRSAHRDRAIALLHALDINTDAKQEGGGHDQDG